jgi:hypothetical protein
VSFGLPISSFFDETALTTDQDDNRPPVLQGGDEEELTLSLPSSTSYDSYSSTDCTPVDHLEGGGYVSPEVETALPTTDEAIDCLLHGEAAVSESRPVVTVTTDTKHAVQSDEDESPISIAASWTRRMLGMRPTSTSPGGSQGTVSKSPK